MKNDENFETYQTQQIWKYSESEEREIDITAYAAEPLVKLNSMFTQRNNTNFDQHERWCAYDGEHGTFNAFFPELIPTAYCPQI